MHPRLLHLCVGLMCLSPSGAMSDSARAAEDRWIDLTGGQSLDAWKPPTGAWTYVGAVHLDPKDPKKLAAEPGASGVLYNGPTGRTGNLVTREKYGDLDLHLEFLVPKGSNSGVKFAEVYEIQICDSFGKKDVTGSDCGGIYPRAELLPRYHHIDEGHAPKSNACRPPGEWQTLDATFHAPRFDAGGKKTADARFVKVVLNGTLIHEDLAAATPTGNNWNHKETPTGALFLQADHGPVAFRNVRVRPLSGPSK